MQRTGHAMGVYGFHMSGSCVAGWLGGQTACLAAIMVCSCTNVSDS